MPSSGQDIPQDTLSWAVQCAQTDDSISISDNEQCTWVVHLLLFAPRKGWPEGGEKLANLVCLSLFPTTVQKRSCVTQAYRRQNHPKTINNHNKTFGILLHIPININMSSTQAPKYFTSHFNRSEHISVDHTKWASMNLRGSLLRKETHFPAFSIVFIRRRCTAAQQWKRLPKRFWEKRKEHLHSSSGQLKSKAIIWNDYCALVLQYTCSHSLLTLHRTPLLSSDSVCLSNCWIWSI